MTRNERHPQTESDLGKITADWTIAIVTFSAPYLRSPV
jgi:hypothetical protein